MEIDKKQIGHSTVPLIPYLCEKFAEYVCEIQWKQLTSLRLACARYLVPLDAVRFMLFAFATGSVLT